MPSMNVEQARFNMIEQQIRPWDVLDSSVLALLSAVRREDFIPADHRAQAFMDLEIPLAGGRTLLAPRVEARLVQDLNLSKRDTVLQIGTGTGYITALLAHKSQRVITLESDAALATAARAKQTAHKASQAKPLMTPSCWPARWRRCHKSCWINSRSAAACWPSWDKNP
jgi:protein-L-isoaspartate(D-aspartate) O-methyltransferase